VRAAHTGLCHSPVVGRRISNSRDPCTMQCATRLRYGPEPARIVHAALTHRREQCANESSSPRTSLSESPATCGRGARRCVRPRACCRSADRVALLVKQLADAAHQQHFMMLVIAAVAPSLGWLQLRELLPQ